MSKRHFVVIDPGAKIAEVECLNAISLMASLPVTYHLPAIAGTKSLLEDHSEIAGILIFGSSTSVHDNPKWQNTLLEWLVPQMEERKVPALGICYAHQLIAYHYGAKVEFLTPAHDKREGFHEVQFQAQWTGKAMQGELLLSHREIVATCPDSMNIVAKSEAIAIEGLKHKTLPIWTLQAHPEATPGFVSNLGLPKEENKDRFQFGHRLIKEFLAFCQQDQV